MGPDFRQEKFDILTLTTSSFGCAVEETPIMKSEIGYRQSRDAVSDRR